MVLYLTVGLIQGLIHEVLRRAVITHKRLFWWDIPGRIGNYFIYIFCAALIFLVPLYLVTQADPNNWQQFVWYWIGGVVLGIFFSRIFVKRV
jgi:hypothetical protein